MLRKYPKQKIIMRNLYHKLRPVQGKYNKILIEGTEYKCKYSISGNNNRIDVGLNSIIKNTEFHISGNNNKIIIGNNCKIIQWGNLWIDGDYNNIIIGNRTTIQSAHLCAQGTGTKIDIGDECMLSNTIQIRTSDSHPIYKKDTNLQINPEGNVIIEPHVWISAQATIMKNVRVGAESVIGFGSIVTKDIPANSMAVGIPAKIVKSEIVWKRSKDIPFTN